MTALLIQVLTNVNLKNKASSYFTIKRLYLGRAENCNTGQASYGKTTSTYTEQRRIDCFTEEEKLGDCSKQKVHWRKLGVPCVMAAHWLSCSSVWLAGLLPEVTETLPSSYRW